MSRHTVVSVLMVLLVQGCASLGHAPEPREPTLASLYETIPIFENSLPQCRFDVIEPINVELPLDSPEVVEQVTARAMFVGGDALVRLPTFAPLDESPGGKIRRCSLAIIKFRKWTCQH